MVLVGGTLDIGTGANVAGTLSTSGCSTIELGGGTGTLSFTGAGTWSGTLNLTGTLGAHSLRFGTDANGLSAERLLTITYEGKPVKLNDSGYVVPGALSPTVFRFR